MRKTFNITMTLDDIYGSDGVDGFNDAVEEMLGGMGELGEDDVLSGLAYTPLSVIGDLIEIEVTADIEGGDDEDESND
jgi:hypothetical protein